MIGRRRFLVASGAAVLAAGCRSSSEPSAEAKAGPADGPPVVLVHGSAHGGWCWKRVAEPLWNAGRRVYTPTQTGLGERSHLPAEGVTLDVFVRDVVNVLEWEDLTDVVLVGHSFGGVTITGVADRIPERIRHLVYLDALILENGQSTVSVMPPDVVAARRQRAAELGGALMPAPDRSVLTATMGITEEGDLAWLEAKMTPHPMSTYEDALTLQAPVGNGRPVTYVAATQPEYAATAPSRAFARRQPGWKYVELATGHHAPVTAPAEVADLLLGL